MAINHNSVFSITFGQNNYVRNLLNRDNVKRSQDYDAAVGGSSRVASGGGEVPVSLDGFTTGQHLILETDSEVDVVINATNTIKLKPVSGQIARMWLDGSSVTALKFVNSTATTAWVQWFIAGTV